MNRSDTLTVPSAGSHVRIRRTVAAAALMALALGVAVTPGVRGRLSGSLSKAFGGSSFPRLKFSDPPTDDEFLRVGLFGQPLIAVGPTNPAEKKELATLLVAYSDALHEGDRDAVQPLAEFAAQHPTSVWTPGLELELGAVYRTTGHFSKALVTWQSAWDASRNLSSANGHIVGDMAAAYLSQFEAYLGRKELLAPLLDDLKTRPVRGSAAELISESSRGLAEMETHPDVSFKCGPSALSRILRYAPTKDPAASRRILAEAKSTPNGLSLTAVQAMSLDAGMNYQMAFRSPGAPVIFPAVANWKVGHYAAILGRDERDRLLVGDATFGEDIAIAQSTLDEEASGYFLVPSGALPEGWRRVDTDEGNTVWGRGNTGQNHDNGATGRPEVQAFPSKGCGFNGCTDWNVEAAVVGLELRDDPGGYKPPFGPEIQFSMTYSHRDSVQPDLFTYTNFGNKWTFNWLSYVVDNPHGEVWIGQPGNGGYIDGFAEQSPIAYAQPTLYATADLYRRGGGDEPYLFPGISSSSAQPEGTAQASIAGQFSQAILRRIVSPTGAVSFIRTLPDGSAEKFTLPKAGYDPNFGSIPLTEYFMTEVDDAQGNAVTIQYDALTRITSVTDAAGKSSTICYNGSSAPCTAVTNPPPSNLQVTEIVDPFLRTIKFGYDAATGHLASITDVLGIPSSYVYSDSGVSSDFITQLTTPYKKVTFAYLDSLNANATGFTDRTLTATENDLLTNAPSRTSFVQYHESSNIYTGANGAGCQPVTSTFPSPAIPTVPVGTTLDEATNGIECTDGALPPTLSLPNNVTIENTNLQWRNTFVWNAEQYAVHPGVFLDAKVLHWLHTDDSDSNSLTASRVLESVKEPQESRVWFTYPGQSANEFATSQNPESISVGATNQPTTVVRAVASAAGPCTAKTCQIWQYQYDDYGHVTQSVDPAGRTLSMTYDPSNHVDLLTVKNITAGKSDELLTLSNYINHRPQQVTGASGVTTQLRYTAQGQQTTSTDPLGNTWTNTYTGGFLTGVAGPPVDVPVSQGGGVQIATYSFTYDNVGRLWTSTGPDEQMLTYSYDSADRLTATLFPDNTTETRSYTYEGQVFLDLTSFTDRMGYVTGRKYNGFRDLVEIDEPAARTTTLTYKPDGTVQTITDPLGTGHVTTYARDGQGRVQTITYPDGSTQWYAYDELGRVTSKSPDQAATLPGTIQYAYNLDNTVYEALLDARAPTVFSYDPEYPRLTGWSRIQGGTWAQPTCAAGATCEVLDQESYTYWPVGSNGANKIRGVETSFTPEAPAPTAMTTVNYGYVYDSLDRPSNRNISWMFGGATTLTSEAFAYDNMGRLTQDTNPLGGFAYAYRDATARVSGRTSASGPQMAASYFPPQKEDGLLETLTYTTPSGTALAQYGYTYDDRHNVSSFYDSNAGTSTYTYDAYSQLQTAALPSAGSPVFGAVPDLAGNIKSLQTVTQGHTAPNSPIQQTFYTTSLLSMNYDVANKLTQATASTTTTSLTGTPSSTVEPIVCDGSVGSLDTISSGITTQLAYQYDDSNRLASYSVGNYLWPTQESSFLYDGLGRLSQVIDEVHAKREYTMAVAADHSYFWCGQKVCMEIDNTNVVTSGTTTAGLPDALYFEQGSISSPTTATAQLDYDVTDLLGSERAVVTNNAIAAEYTYDTFGNRTTVSGSTTASNRGFTGFYYHAASGLQFARNRVYDSSLGRWLTRDPIGIDHAFDDEERFNATDLNLYAYAGNNPQSMVDPSGNNPIAIGGFFLGGGEFFPPALIGGLAAAAIVYGEQGIDAYFANLAQQQGTITPVRPYPSGDGTTPPEEGWEWHGPDPPGGDRGGWVNPETGESLHPDLGHPEPEGPHWDWNTPNGGRYRINPDGSVVPKNKKCK